MQHDYISAAHKQNHRGLCFPSLRSREHRIVLIETGQTVAGRLVLITAVHCCGGGERQLDAAARSPHAPLIATTWPVLAWTGPPPLCPSSPPSAQCLLPPAHYWLPGAQQWSWPGVPQASTQRSGKAACQQLKTGSGVHHQTPEVNLKDGKLKVVLSNVSLKRTW